jgi:hypothetical protein
MQPFVCGSNQETVNLYLQQRGVRISSGFDGNCCLQPRRQQSGYSYWARRQSGVNVRQSYHVVMNQYAMSDSASG